ncbi:MAG: hypothetical protein HY721_19945 [Planctomycetes bacterium]|nr:hypothetical protein [Planctomycetota bacterium]
MSAARTESGPGHEAIGSRLRELRRLLRSSVFFRGASLLLVALAFLAAASFAIDRTFRLSLPWRAAAAAVYIAALGWLAWKVLLRPISRRLPDASLADLLESRLPHLLDRLRSAVEFLREPAARSAAPPADIGDAMKRRVIEEAVAEARRLDVSSAVDTPAVVSALAGGVAALAAGAIAATLLGASFVTWVERDVLFRDVDWPYRTRLVVEGFPEDTLAIGVPRGDRLRLSVRAQGEVPERVRITVRYERERFRANLPREGERIFVYEGPEVTEPFELVVEGGDFRSRSHRVLVKERPEVRSIRVTVEPPAYTGRPAVTLEGDAGEVPVPEGGTLRVQGSASKDLARAWLETEGKDVPLEVAAGDPRAFAGAYRPEAGGAVTVRLADVEGVPQLLPHRFIVAPVPDRPPVVLARAEGVGSMVTPQARIPFKVRAADDYAVTSLGIGFQVARTDAGPDGAREARKGSHPFAPVDAPAPLVEAEPAWELEPLAIEPEARLDARVFAADSDGIRGPKPGHAATQSFLVVTPERLGEELLRREEEQRRILERVVADERAVRDAVYKLAEEAWMKEGPLAEAAVQEMVALAKTERQLARQTASIAGAIQLISEEMRNNRLGEVEEMQRLVAAVVEPLTDVSERLLPLVASRLGQIRELQRGDERLKDGITLAGHIEALIQRLEAVLASLRRLEGFTEVVNRLRGIIKVHEASAEEAKRSYRREVDSIFEGPAPGGEGSGGLGNPGEKR